MANESQNMCFLQIIPQRHEAFLFERWWFPQNSSQDKKREKTCTWSHQLGTGGHAGRLYAGPTRINKTGSQGSNLQQNENPSSLPWPTAWPHAILSCHICPLIFPSSCLPSSCSSNTNILSSLEPIGLCRDIISPHWGKAISFVSLRPLIHVTSHRAFPQQPFAHHSGTSPCFIFFVEFTAAWSHHEHLFICILPISPNWMYAPWLWRAGLSGILGAPPRCLEQHLAFKKCLSNE